MCVLQATYYRGDGMGAMDYQFDLADRHEVLMQAIGSAEISSRLTRSRTLRCMVRMLAIAVHKYP